MQLTKTNTNFKNSGYRIATISYYIDLVGHELTLPMTVYYDYDSIEDTINIVHVEVTNHSNKFLSTINKELQEDFKYDHNWKPVEEYLVGQIQKEAVA